MENSVPPQKPEAPKPPLTPEQLVDLRARVLRGEEVSDEELKHALNSLAMSRGVAPAASSKSSATPAYVPKGSLADRMAAFKAKTQQTDAAGSPVVEQPKPQ